MVKRHAFKNQESNIRTNSNSAIQLSTNNCTQEFARGRIEKISNRKISQWFVCLKVTVSNLSIYLIDGGKVTGTVPPFICMSVRLVRAHFDGYFAGNNTLGSLHQYDVIIFPSWD